MEKWEEEKDWKPYPLEKVISFLRNQMVNFRNKEAPFSVYNIESAIVYLNQVDQDDWLPIDYGEAASGKGCFDGGVYLLKISASNHVHIVTARRCKDPHINIGLWITAQGRLPTNCSATHYRPIPKGWLE